MEDLNRLLDRVDAVLEDPETGRRAWIVSENEGYGGRADMTPEGVERARRVYGDR